MGMKWIDMEHYSRKEQFDFFYNYANPYVGVTVDVDITDFMKKLRKEGYPFFLSFLYHIGRTANHVAQFRQRIREKQIVEYDNCVASITVLRENGNFAYCDIDTTGEFPAYLDREKKVLETAKREATIDKDEKDAEGKIFISSVPWFSQTALIQPTPFPADSNPRITWGKYFEREGRCWIPVSVLGHHSLIDGIHLGKFYQTLEGSLKDE